MNRGNFILAVVLVSLVALGGVVRAADPNLIGWWTFDQEGAALAEDASGHDNTGTVNGDPTWVTGVLGSALDFDGIDDYVGTDRSLLNDLPQFTMACWISVANYTTNRTGLVGQNDCLEFGFNNSGDLRCWSAGVGGNVSFRYPHAYPSWHHVAVVGRANGLFLYIDGQQVAGPSGPPKGNYGTSTYKVNIGGGGIYDPTGNWLRGQMDDVRIYNRALTAEEIKALNPPKLQAYQPQPADGDRAVATPLFRWTAGDKAVLHDVYLGTKPDLGPADLVSPRTFAPMYYHTPGLQPGTTYYWRVDEIEADMTTVHTGNVWSFTTQALTAYLPNPQDGDVSVSPAGTLSWLPGRNASKHRVYLSDSRDAVAQGTADANKGEQKETTFTPAGLTQTTTYYWRVDEVVADGTIQAGPVWTFTTYLPVDDFESYTDDLAAKTTIFDTWIDGLTNGLSGSVVGNTTAPFAEQKVVHGGKQSMPLDYNNIKSPFYSEAERESATAQDWTAGEVGTLVLFVRGKLSNGPAPLYFVVKDSSNHTATVLHPDAAVVSATKWTEWKIPLTSFTGVNLAKIKKITIGVGDKANAKAGGAGRIFVDDIYVRKSTPEQ